VRRRAVVPTRLAVAKLLSAEMAASGLLLAGPSSSGKTALATALQRVLRDPWLYLPSDALTAGFPKDRAEFVSIDTDRRLRTGALAALLAFMDAGLNVIVGLSRLRKHVLYRLARPVDPAINQLER
jgi:adenylylsulfate kinase-like enzyme